MRCAIIGDIHGNLEAFQSVLRDIDSRGGCDRIWCLGDVVGYGPDPHGCIELLRQHEHICVAGNHDWAAVGKLDTSDFNSDAARACHWTAQQLTEEDIDYLRNLPDRLVQHDFTLVHGSPRHPIWEYLFSVEEAWENFACFETTFCLVGHSHVPLLFEYVNNSVIMRSLFHDNNLRLGESRLILNPGGVGQPRDGDHRASYAIYDAKARVLSHYRVEYDIETTQMKMEGHELPPRLISRLSYGW